MASVLPLALLPTLDRPTASGLRRRAAPVRGRRRRRSGRAGALRVDLARRSGRRRAAGAPGRRRRRARGAAAATWAMASRSSAPRGWPSGSPAAWRAARRRRAAARPRARRTLPALDRCCSAPAAVRGEHAVAATARVLVVTWILGRVAPCPPTAPRPARRRCGRGEAGAVDVGRRRGAACHRTSAAFWQTAPRPDGARRPRQGRSSGPCSSASVLGSAAAGGRRPAAPTPSGQRALRLGGRALARRPTARYVLHLLSSQRRPGAAGLGRSTWWLARRLSWKFGTERSHWLVQRCWLAARSRRRVAVQPSAVAGAARRGWRCSRRRARAVQPFAGRTRAAASSLGRQGGPRPSRGPEIGLVVVEGLQLVERELRVLALLPAKRVPLRHAPGHSRHAAWVALAAREHPASRRTRALRRGRASSAGGRSTSARAACRSCSGSRVATASAMSSSSTPLRRSSCCSARRRVLDRGARRYPLLREARRRSSRPRGAAEHLVRDRVLDAFRAAPRRAPRARGSRDSSRRRQIWGRRRRGSSRWSGRLLSARRTLETFRRDPCRAAVRRPGKLAGIRREAASDEGTCGEGHGSRGRPGRSAQVGVDHWADAEASP